MWIPSFRTATTCSRYVGFGYELSLEYGMFCSGCDGYCFLCAHFWAYGCYVLCVASGWWVTYQQQVPTLLGTFHGHYLPHPVFPSSGCQSILDKSLLWFCLHILWPRWTWFQSAHSLFFRCTWWIIEQRRKTCHHPSQCALRRMATPLCLRMTRITTLMFDIIHWIPAIDFALDQHLWECNSVRDIPSQS